MSLYAYYYMQGLKCNSICSSPVFPPEKCVCVSMHLIEVAFLIGCFLSPVLCSFLSTRAKGDAHFCPPSVHNNLFLFHKGFFVSFQVKSVINLLFAAYTGDVSALRRYFFTLLPPSLFSVFYSTSVTFPLWWLQVCTVLHGHGAAGLWLQDSASRSSRWGYTTAHAVTLVCHLLGVKNHWYLLVRFILYLLVSDCLM